MRTFSLNNHRKTPTPAATPRKRGRRKSDDGDPKKAKTASSNKGAPETPTSNGKDDMPTSPKKTSIPTSYEAASAEDKMLLHMKDVEKRSWSKIKEAWEAATGTKVAVGTLSVRYLRIKANFTVFREEDVSGNLVEK
jgi:hypothetical protein